MARLMPGWDVRRPQRRQSVACERFDTDERRPGYRLFVPARTNRHQAVVFYVKQHIAPEGAQVTESKELFDVDSGKCREVDIVVNYLIGDDPVVISVEVTARTSRRADLPWVESMLKKHERMPTGRLVLVSWSGFTKAALQTVKRQGDRVAAVTPERIENAKATDVHFQQVQAPTDSVTLLVRAEPVNRCETSFRRAG